MTDVASTRRFLLSARDNPHAPVRANGRRFWGHPSRRGGLEAIRVIAVHTTEGGTAMSTARWQAHEADQPTSYHVIAEPDGLLRTLEDEAVAFHIAGFNTPSLGLSFAGAAADWGDDPDRDRAAIAHGARQAAAWADAQHIPTRWLTRAQAEAGHAGFVRHSVMDPDRRGDPGDGFPAEEFFTLIDDQEEIMATADELRTIVREELRQALPDDLLRERANETVRLTLAAAAGAVAGLRQQLGLEPDPASDMIWARRIREDQASLEEAYAALLDKAG